MCSSDLAETEGWTVTQDPSPRRRGGIRSELGTGQNFRKDQARISGTCKPVFLTGATGKIGRAVTLKLAENGISVVMFSASSGRASRIRNEAGGNAIRIAHTDDPTNARDCGLAITGKAGPGMKNLLLKCLPEGSVALNFAVPNPLDISALRRRPDLQLVSGGMLEYDRRSTDLKFAMRLSHVPSNGVRGSRALRQ